MDGVVFDGAGADDGAKGGAPGAHGDARESGSTGDAVSACGACDVLARFCDAFFGDDHACDVLARFCYSDAFVGDDACDADGGAHAC